VSDMTKIVIGFVLIAVALIVFPIILTASNEVLNWTGTGSATIADFTGLQTLVAIAPLLVFVAFLAGGGILTFQGFKGRSSSGKSGKSGRSLR
jgi:hypothetical protein